MADNDAAVAVAVFGGLVIAGAGVYLLTKSQVSVPPGGGCPGGCPAPSICNATTKKCVNPPTGGNCPGGCQPPRICNPATNTCVNPGGCQYELVCNTPGQVWDFTQCACVPSGGPGANGWSITSVGIEINDLVSPAQSGANYKPAVTFLYTGPGGNVTVGFYVTPHGANVGSSCTQNLSATISLAPQSQPFFIRATLDIVWPDLCSLCSLNQNATFDLQPYVIDSDGNEYDGTQCYQCVTVQCTAPPAEWYFTNISLDPGPATNYQVGLDYAPNISFQYTGPGGTVKIGYYVSNSQFNCSQQLGSTVVLPAQNQLTSFSVSVPVTWPNYCGQCTIDANVNFDLEPYIIDPQGTEYDGPYCLSCVSTDCSTPPGW